MTPLMFRAASSSRPEAAERLRSLTSVGTDADSPVVVLYGPAGWARPHWNAARPRARREGDARDSIFVNLGWVSDPLDDPTRAVR